MNFSSFQDYETDVHQPQPDQSFNVMEYMNKYEKILTHETDESGVRRYLVKLTNKSYKDLEWATERDFLMTQKGRSKLQKYKKMYGNEPPKPPYFDPDYIIPEMIVAEDEKRYLIKWKSLELDCSTWEMKNSETSRKLDPKLLSEFRTRMRIPAIKDHHDYQYKPIYQLPPSKTGFVARDYQIQGLNFLLERYMNHKNCMLADEMGLGKTLQVSIFLNELYKNFERQGNFIIIVPLSTISHWENELYEWTDMRFLSFKGTKENREILKKYMFFYPKTSIAQFNALITTYEFVTREVDLFKKIDWDVVVVDEAHRLKNLQSIISKSVLQLNIKFKLLLTGTPLQNNVQELWSLLHFLDPDTFDQLEEFTERFGQMENQSQLAELQDLLRPIMLRRLKSSVEKDLTPIEEIIIECPMTHVQKFYYKQIYTKNTSFLMRGAHKNNTNSLKNISMELRKVINHPYLINGAEQQILEDIGAHTSEEVNDNLIKVCGKMILLDKLLKKLRDGGHKVLLFSQMKLMIDIIQDYVTNNHMPFCRIDGGVRGEDRKEMIERFNNPDNGIFIFLLTTHAGGQGINLTAADTVIIYDSDWNPQNDIQATARCHRIGQDKDVKVYRFLTSNSYERSMFDKASMKLGLDHAVLEGGKNGVEKPQELEKLLRLGAYYAFKTNDQEEDTIISEDIDTILAHSLRIRHDSVFGGEGSTFSKAQFEINDSELQAPDFWKKYLPDSQIDEDSDDVEPNSDDIWTQKRFKKVMKGILDYGISRRKKIQEACPSQITATDIKIASKAILEWMLQAADTKSNVMMQINERLEKKTSTADLEALNKFKRRYVADFQPMVFPRAVENLQRLEMLHFLNCVMTTCRNAPEGLVVPTAPNALPNDTWTANDDRQLMFGVWTNGISKYAVKGCSPKSLVNRLFILVDGLKKLFTYYHTHFQGILFSHDTLQAAKDLWKVPEHNAVIKALLNFGFSSLDRFMQRLNLPTKPPEIIKSYVEQIIALINEDTEDQYVLADSLDFSKIQTLRERYNFFKQVRLYLQKHPDAPEPVKRVAENGMSSMTEFGTPAQITKYVYSLIKLEKPIERKPVDARFPMQLSASMTLMNIGKLVLNRSAFHSERYIYPAGYMCERKYTDVRNPSDRTWYVSTIVDTGGEVPLFRVYLKEDEKIMFEGSSPSKVWSDVLMRVNEAKNSAGDVKERHKTISGPEYFGLRHPAVQKMFAEMEGVEQLKNFRPQEDDGQSSERKEYSRPAMSPPSEPAPRTPPPPVQTREREYEINFKRLFERARMYGK